MLKKDRNIGKKSAKCSLFLCLVACIQDGQAGSLWDARWTTPFGLNICTSVDKRECYSNQSFILNKHISAFRKNILIKNLCEKVDKRYRQLGWKQSPCKKILWSFDTVTEGGAPLVYSVFGNHSLAHGTTTIIFGGVHPDEITPIYLSFRVAEILDARPELLGPHNRVVLAPLINPDGFFQVPSKRTNLNGVDLNRNFRTDDWWPKATRVWMGRKRADPRHFPGRAPDTEQGTRFQKNLIERFYPDKMLSIHAPLDLLDYDGPGDEKKNSYNEMEQKAKKLVRIISKHSKNSRIIDYGVFPGSLGTYAGKQLHIPTITVELPSTNARLAEKYTQTFLPGLISAIQYDFHKHPNWKVAVQQSIFFTQSFSEQGYRL